MKREAKVAAGLICFALTVVLATTAAPVHAAENGVRLISYDVECAVTQGGDSLVVSAACKFGIEDTTTRLLVLLDPDAKITGVTVGGVGHAHRAELSFRSGGGDSLTVFLPPWLSRQKSLTAVFHYTLAICSPLDSLLLLDRGSRWYPLIADQVAPFRLACMVPPGLTVLSAGDPAKAERSGDGMRFVWESKLPVFKLPLVVFRTELFSRSEITVGTKSLVVYSSSVDRESVDSALTGALGAFGFFTNLLDEYPYKSLTFVEVPYFDGMDISSGLVMAGSSSLRAAGKGYFESIHLAVAEQWIGAGVFGEFHRPGFWFMTVSLPHFLRLMYLRHFQGRQAYEAALREPMEKYTRFAGTKDDTPILDVDYPNTREKGLVIYGKGPYVLSRLEEGLGKENWAGFLRYIYKNYSGKVVTYGEFRSAIGKFTGSRGVLDEFDAMMTRKGIPAG